MAKRRLVRGKDKVFGGVCSGLAAYWDSDPTAVRIIWAILTVFTAIIPGLIAYFICWVLMPPR